MPDPLIPPTDPDDVPRRLPVDPPRSIVCEFCECVLAPSGDYVSLSPKAKLLREQEETIDKLNKQITTAREETETARNALASAQREIAELKKPKGWGDRKVISR